MTDPETERERIRERKRKELMEKQGGTVGGADSGAVKDGSSPDDSASTPGEPIQITGNDHLETVLADHDVVLVDCYADWCGPCQMMEPTIETLAAESDAAVAKVDVDRHQRLSQQLGVQGVPTLVLFVDGEPAERLVGAQDRATLEQLLQRAK